MPDSPAPALRAPLAVELRAAAHALERVRAGQALPAALSDALARWRVAGASRAAVHEFAYSAVRRLGTAMALGERLNARAPSPPVAALQATALAQLLAPGRRVSIRPPPRPPPS